MSERQKVTKAELERKRLRLQQIREDKKRREEEKKKEVRKKNQESTSLLLGVRSWIVYV